ncbi:DUF503 domain-containing protein [Singulisphaera sp. Ch08]|uniref:DUF503 domain-containing protein n=1 Tax=Singulisphaera sp. Ch08 TaxID=3120278 RepID=A0AAU7CQF6_9BACT
MTLATLRLELRVANCESLREKRRRMQAIMSKLRQHFNVSITEDGRIDDPSSALLIVAVVGRTRRDTRETLDRVADAVAAYPRAELLSQVITEV